MFGKTQQFLLCSIWELEASRCDQNDVRECANIFHYRPAHSENLTSSIIFDLTPSGPGPKWAQGPSAQVGPGGPSGPRAQVGPGPNWAGPAQAHHPGSQDDCLKSSWPSCTGLYPCGRTSSTAIINQKACRVLKCELETSAWRESVQPLKETYSIPKVTCFIIKINS